MQHEINEQKNEAFNVSIVFNIESSAVTETSANLINNASKNETFNVQLIASPNIEVNEQFNTSLNVPEAIKLSTTMETLANDAFKHRFTSLNETSPTEDTGTDIDEKNISNAIDLSNTTDFSDAVDFSNAADPSNTADQISDNSLNNQSELATPIAPIKRDRGEPCKNSIEIDFTFMNETSSVASVPYVFNSTIDIRYDSSAYKDLLIDSETTSRFTKSMKHM